MQEVIARGGGKVAASSMQVASHLSGRAAEILFERPRELIRADIAAQYRHFTHGIIRTCQQNGRAL